MRVILLALIMGSGVSAVSANADDLAEINKLAAHCETPIGWSIFDVRYTERYTHVACGHSDSEDRFAIDYHIRLKDGQVTLIKRPLRGKVSYPVYVDGPVMFWVAGDEDALYRTDLDTGVETKVADTHDEAGRQPDKPQRDSAWR